jgi:hypothetical protein
MREHHHLGLDTFVGENMRFIAEIDGQWVALMGWCAVALAVTVGTAAWAGTTSSARSDCGSLPRTPGF